MVIPAQVPSGHCHTHQLCWYAHSHQGQCPYLDLKPDLTPKLVMFLLQHVACQEGRALKAQGRLGTEGAGPGYLQSGRGGGSHRRCRQAACGSRSTPGQPSGNTWEGRGLRAPWALGKAGGEEPQGPTSPGLPPRAPSPYLLCTTMAALGSPVVPDV